MTRLKDSLRFDQLLPALAAGLVSGILTIVMDISLAALLFSGDMRVHIPYGIGLTLFGSMVMPRNAVSRGGLSCSWYFSPIGL